MMLKREKPLIITLSIIILAALLYVIFSLNKLTTSNISPNINSEKGVLDISNWDFKKDGYTALSGQWGFYEHQLLSPKDFVTTSTVPSYIEMPTSFNKNNKKFNTNGCATYSLTIKLNPKYKDTLLGISVPSMLSSYKLWINGYLYSSNGIVSTTSSDKRLKSMPITSYFMNNTDKVHLVLQVSNSAFSDEGAKNNIYLGTESQMTNKREASIALKYFYFGALLIMALYHIWLYSFRTDDVSKLYFGALCIVISLRALIIGDNYFLTFYNSLSYSLVNKLELLTFYAAIYFILSYICAVFKNDFSKNINKSCKYFCVFFIVTTIFISPLLALKFFMVFQISTLLIILYATFIILKSYHSKIQKILIVMIGCLVIIAISAMSMLHYLDINNISDYSLLGFFIFILLNAFILGKNQSNSSIKIENLSKEKEEYLLEEKLREVTLHLNSSLNLEEVLDKLIISLKDLIPYDSASFFMEENDHFNIIVASGFKNMEDIHKISINRKDDKLFKQISETNTILIVSNVKEDPRFSHYINSTNIESWIGIPIMFKNKIVGILTLDSTEKNIYTKYHSDIALYFAYHTGMAIENAKLHSKTKHLASIDHLTNLYNRRSFFELANISFDKAKALIQPISGIMIDIDDFKKINDNLGHHTGDLVLMRLSKVCSETLSDTHILGRFGGEEFIVLLPSTSFEEAEIIGEKLRSAIECNPIIIRKSDLIPLTLSLGVASITPTVEDLDYLLRTADKALYQAKSLGKNQVVSINLDS